jgi:DNA-binding transcriptional LysR family regulator
MHKRSLNSAAWHWDDFRYLLATARSGRYKLAAKTLQTAETTVGRRVRALEERVGARLVDRRLGGVSLTPAGRSALEDIEVMEQAAARVERTLFGSDQRLLGPIRVTTTDGLGSYWLTPRLGEFRAQYPDIQVEIVVSNDVLDLGAREADIAIRYARPIDPNLVGVEMGTVRFDLVCTKEYAARNGLPNSLEGLRRHTLIDHGPYGTIPVWRALLDVGAPIAYRSNSVVAFYQAIGSGIGIGLVPRFARRAAGDVVALDFSLDCSVPVWLVSHRETNKAARTQAMWAYLKERFRGDRAEAFT